MQSIPVFDTIEGLTVFRDDDDYAHFFYLPRTLRVAKGSDGKPMFTFLKYQLPVERETEDDKGGGYLVFTTQLVEDGDFLETKVKPKLADRMRAERPNDPQLPPPKLTAIDFVTGEVRLLIMKDDKFVGTVQAGKPSMFADNSASFAVELKDLGAELLYQAMKKGGGVAVVEYDLGFETRLPAVHVYAHCDSKEVKDVVMTYTTSQIHDEDTWGNETTTTEAHRTSISETMESQGLITLNIDKGSSQIKDEDVEALRGFAFSKLDGWLKDHFLQGGSIATDKDRESAWMSFIHEDIHQVFNLDLVQRDVVIRQYNPSATLDSTSTSGRRSGTSTPSPSRSTPTSTSTPMATSSTASSATSATKASRTGRTSPSGRASPSPRPTAPRRPSPPGSPRSARTPTRSRSRSTTAQVR